MKMDFDGTALINSDVVSLFYRIPNATPPFFCRVRVKYEISRPRLFIITNIMLPMIAKPALKLNADIVLS